MVREKGFSPALEKKIHIFVSLDHKSSYYLLLCTRRISRPIFKSFLVLEGRIAENKPKLSVTPSCAPRYKRASSRLARVGVFR